MKDRIKKVMAAVFEMPVEEISENSSPHEIEAWDSLKHMNLVLALEDEFNILFEDHEVQSLVSFKIIEAALKAHLEGADV